MKGQLGALKDPDKGIYPFVSSSSPLSGFASVGAGIPLREIKTVTTVVKSYSSCVGAGEFVTEIFGVDAERLRSLGGDCGEYGAKTGRPRRVGWLDLVASRYGCILQGSSEVVLTLLDVLGYLDMIPVCVAYELDGNKCKDFPNSSVLKSAKPVYEYLEGWKSDIRNIRNYSDLPLNTQKYVEFVEKGLGYPINLISNGSGRDQVIIRKGQ